MSACPVGVGQDMSAIYASHTGYSKIYSLKVTIRNVGVARLTWAVSNLGLTPQLWPIFASYSFFIVHC